MDELISVVVPIYNVEKYLPKCLESIINQTYRNLEIILIDDGSPDNCGKICDEYAKKDARISVIHKPNAGLMAAWMDGVRQSKGDYIYFVDSDDWLELNSVQDYVNIILNDHPDMIINTYFIATENKKIPSWATKYPQKGLIEKTELDQFKFALLNNKYFMKYYRWNKIIKRELIVNNLKYCDTRISIFEDIGITLASLLDAEKIYLADNPTYNYFVRPNSMINIKFKPEYIENYSLVLKSITNILNGKNIEKNGINYLSINNLWLLMDLIERVMHSKIDKKMTLKLIKDSYLIENEFKDIILTKASFANKITYKLLTKGHFKSLIVFRKNVDFIRRIIKRN